MKNVVYFIRAVARNSIYYLTSSAAAALITVYEHVRGASIAARLFLVVAVGLLMGAFYKTWLEERQRIVALESEVLSTRKDLETERARRPVEEAQAKLLDAQREEIEARKKARQAQEEHEERMRLLTAPDTGIRHFVTVATSGKHSSAVFTAEMLAVGLQSSKSEIEEALRILRLRDLPRKRGCRGIGS